MPSHAYPRESTTQVFQHIQTEIILHKLNSQNKNKKHHTHENIISLTKKRTWLHHGQTLKPKSESNKGVTSK